jgi:hypothetical protein
LNSGRRLQGVALLSSTSKWFTVNKQMVYRQQANDSPPTSKWFTANNQMVHHQQANDPSALWF